MEKSSTPAVSKLSEYKPNADSDDLDHFFVRVVFWTVLLPAIFGTVAMLSKIVTPFSRALKP